MSARPRANRGPRHHTAASWLGRGPALIVGLALEVSLDVHRLQVTIPSRARCRTLTWSAANV
eukprot:3474918-Prymnesium_polylepis.1